MLSRREAEAAADALLEAARKQQDENSPLLKKYPMLASIPHSERRPMVRAATQAVWRRWPMLVAVGVVVMVAGSWVWAAFAKTEIANDTWWAPFLIALLSHQVGERLVRRELQREVARQRTRDQ